MPRLFASRKITAAVFFAYLCLAAVATLQAQEQQPTDQQKRIIAQLQGLRKLPDDTRSGATKQLALEIRKLPAPAKLSLAYHLSSLATEGDFGRETLQEVATTLAEALREQPNQSDQSDAAYFELAQLVRYEHVQVSLDNKHMASATAKLEADERARAEADFTLADLQGKTWTLKALRGKVVLVNFWATWCPPCRKEMPDLDALYHQFANNGLVILAITDEDAGKVEPYLAIHGVAYPILLDPGRKVNELFRINGIPKSFVFDRTGKLVAQSIDMRTRGQFLAMLKQAGLK